MSICLSDTLFLAHTLSPEWKILAVHASGSTVPPSCRYTCSRLQRSIIHIVTNRLMRPCSCSQKMRGHIYPSIHQTDQIDRSLYHHHHCLLRHAEGPGIIPGGSFLFAYAIHMNICMYNSTYNRCMQKVSLYWAVYADMPLASHMVIYMVC